MSESENKSSEVSSNQTFSGFIFGIALGSDLPSAVKDFQAYSNTTNTNTGGQSVGTNLASAGASFVLSAPAGGTGLSARHGGSTDTNDANDINSGNQLEANQTPSFTFGISATPVSTAVALSGQDITTKNEASSGFGGNSAFGVQTPLAGGSLFGSGSSGSSTNYRLSRRQGANGNGSSGTKGSTGGGLFGSVSGASLTTDIGLFGSVGGPSGTTDSTGSELFGSVGGTGFGQTWNSGGFSFGNTSSAATTPFSQNRPLFGTATTTQSGFGFGTSTATPQSTSLFGSPARPLFGGTASTQPSLTGGSSIFGVSAAGASNAVGFGTSTQSGGLFGAAKPTGFGTATTPSIGFGTGESLFAKPTSTASTFGSGTNTSTTGYGTFGANATGNTGGLFGGTSQANKGTSSLFSTPAAGTGFGARPGGFTPFGNTSSAATTPFSQNRPLFGTATTTQSGFGFGTSTATPQSTSLFGSPARPLFGGTASTQPSLTGGSSIFGVSAAGASNAVGFGTSTQSGGLFGAAKPTGFGTATTPSIGFGTGESLFAKPTSTASTFGFGTNTSTTGYGTFGANATGNTGGLFGGTSQANKGTSSLFSTPAAGTGFGARPGGFTAFGNTSSAATTPFSQNRPLFGTATTTQSGFGFGTSTATQQSTSLFGSPARPLFGGTASTQPSLTGGSSFFGVSAAGASNAVGFGTSTQSGGLFGAAKPTGFGTATTPSIGFGTGGSLFAKPTSTASTFGFGTNTSTTGFGTFGANATGNTGGLFGGTSQANKGTSSLFSTPAAGTGFGARPGGFTGFGPSGPTDNSLFGTNTGATSSLFGQTSATGAFGGASASIAAVGTTVPFNPPYGQDTMMKSGGHHKHQH